MGFTTHKHRHELEWMGENEKLVANIARADHVVAYTNIELCLNTESRFGKVCVPYTMMISAKNIPTRLLHYVRISTTTPHI